MGSDVGYSEMRPKTDTWSVRFVVDVYMTGSNVRDLALLRSAETGMKSGVSVMLRTTETRLVQRKSLIESTPNTDYSMLVAVTKLS